MKELLNDVTVWNYHRPNKTEMICYVYRRCEPDYNKPNFVPWQMKLTLHMN